MLSYLKRKFAGYTYRCSDGPDLSGINAAAASNAELGKDALAFYKTAWSDQVPLRERAQANSDAVSAAQLGLMGSQQKIADSQQQDRDNIFRPLEAGIVKDAQAFDTAARRDSAAAQAAAGVSQQFEQQQQMQQRDLARRGVSPGSGRAMALAAQTGIARAAATAGAMSAARDKVELQGYAREMDAANLGRGLASSQATSAGIAVNAGNASATTGNMAAQTAQQGLSVMGQGFNTAMAGAQSSGNLYGQAAQLEAGANSAGMQNMMQAGSTAMMAYQMFSSKKLKTNRRPLNGASADGAEPPERAPGRRPASAEQALKGVAGLNVEQWDYKPGVADEGTHIGPYAEDVQRGLGDAVAPGGRVVDTREMWRANDLAIQALTQQADELERVVQRLEAA